MPIAARMMRARMNAHRAAILQISSLVLAASLAIVLAKRVLLEVPAFTFVWLQLAIGGALLTAFTFARGQRIPAGLGRRVWAYLVCIGVCHFAIVRVLVMLALEKLPATTHAYLVNFVGITTMLLSVVLLRERPSLFQVGGALFALFGLWVFFPQLPPPDELLGVAYMAVAVVALAVTNNVLRIVALATHGSLAIEVVSMVAVWIGGLPVVVAGLLTDWPPPVHGWRPWSVIVLNGLISIAIGMTVFTHALRTLRSYEASVLATSGVVYTAVLAVPLLGERLAPHQIAGIAMMFAGIAAVQIRRGRG